MADEEVVQAQVPLEEENQQPAEQQPAEEDKTPTNARLKAVKPKVGMDAHYVYGGAHVPMTITEILEDGRVSLQGAGGNNIAASPISFDASGAEATWHTPEE